MTVICGTCGKELQRQPYQIQARKRHFCDRTCWARAPERKTAPRDAEFYYCPRCDKDLPRADFIWEVAGGTPRRRGYCQQCSRESRKQYHAEHRDQAKSLHSAWRKLSQARGGDDALNWLFTRRLSAIRYRTRRVTGLPECDLDGSYLVRLYHQQKGLCYYTGQQLIIAPRQQLLETVSIDRLTPNLGYTRGNVVLCAYEVNTSKGSRTEAEFYVFCEKVLLFRQQRAEPLNGCSMTQPNITTD